MPRNRPRDASTPPTEPFVREVQLRREKVASFDRYPFDLPAVRRLTALPLRRPVTFFVGENGSGKSTLLEAIAVAAGFNAEGGSRNFRFTTRGSHSELHEHLRLVKGVRHARTGFFLRAESLFNVATEIERMDAEPAPSFAAPIGPAYGDRALHEQSHGESFLALITNRFSGDGLYLLDEPEAALSPMRQMTLLAVMHGLVREGAQFLIATHSPILLAYPEAEIFQFGQKGIARVAYEETEHYQVTRDFLNRYPLMLRELLEEPAPEEPAG